MSCGRQPSEQIPLAMSPSSTVDWSERQRASNRADTSGAWDSRREVPGWQAPWSRARRCTVLADSLRGLLVSLNGEHVRLYPREIQAGGGEAT